MTLVLVAFIILLGTAALTAVAVSVDRCARATAWRQIALERRWNREQGQRR